MNTKVTFHCFVCDKPLESAFDSGFETNFTTPSNDATCWSSSGNYGSTIFDNEPSARQLEIRICDKCLEERKHRVVSFEFKTERKLVRVGTWETRHAN